MNVRQLFAAFFALIALLLLAGLTGCTDAGKCERGTEGCVCRAAGHSEGRCNGGSSCQDGMCVDNGGGGDGDGDGDGDFEPRDAGATPDVDCEGDTQEEVCDAFCELFCYNQIRFCGRSECTPGDCEEAGLVYGACADPDTGCETIECARILCEAQADPELTCESFGNETELEGEPYFDPFCIDRDPLCVQRHDIGCTDVCGPDNGVNGDYTENGVCEDGAEGSEDTLCDRGTDCIDCGPHPCKAAGVACQNHGDCCGFYGDGALCVDPDDTPSMTGPKPPVCNPVCDRNDPTSCPEGFTCTLTSIQKSVCVPKPASSQ